VSHISPQSARDAASLFKQIEQQFETHTAPAVDVVAVELDAATAEYVKPCAKALRQLQTEQKLSSHGTKFAQQELFQCPAVHRQATEMNVKISNPEQIRIPAQLQAGFASGLIWGDEMMIAMEQAERIGAAVVFLDQEASMKSSGKMAIPWSERAIGALGSAAAAISKDVTAVPTPAEISEQLARMQQYQPTAYRVRVAERDRHMFETLLAIESGGKTESSTGRRTVRRVVAVVGAMHVEGIRELWRVHTAPTAPISNFTAAGVADS
jgi:pheromone shutdown protein TraB